MRVYWFMLINLLYFFNIIIYLGLWSKIFVATLFFCLNFFLLHLWIFITQFFLNFLLFLSFFIKRWSFLIQISILRSCKFVIFDLLFFFKFLLCLFRINKIFYCNKRLILIQIEIKTFFKCLLCDWPYFIKPLFFKQIRNLVLNEIFSQFLKLRLVEIVIFKINIWIKFIFIHLQYFHDLPYWNIKFIQIKGIFLIK